MYSICFCGRGLDPTPPGPEPRKGKVRQRGLGNRGCQMCIIRMRSVRRACGLVWGMGRAPRKPLEEERSRNNQLATMAACSHVQASPLCRPKGHHFRSTLFVFKSLKLRTCSCRIITFRTSYTGATSYAGAANSLRGCSKATCALRSLTTSKPRPH